MKIDSQQFDAITVVKLLENRVDASKAPELKEYFHSLIERGQTLLCIDLSEVSFIDSSGLGALVSVLKKVGQNGRIGLWGLSKEVKALFELTQLYKIFDIFENQEDAITKLKEHAAG